MISKKLINWWFTDLPEVHRKLDLKGKTLWKKIRFVLLCWLIHPIKRRVAKYYLVFLQRFFGLNVIGITGSTGKTTTKEMIASILRQKGKTVVSYANIDHVYNIPTTILKCTPNTKYLVLEMGVEYPREMDFYLWLARPSIGVITNISVTHTQFLKNVAGVLREKCKLVESLGKQNFAVLNKENSFLLNISDKIKAQLVWFGENSQVSAKRIGIDENLGSFYTLSIGKQNLKIILPVVGRQFVSDSLAAAATSHILGASLVQIKNGLERFQSLEHRMQLKRLKSGTLIIDDTYNNNPAAAIESLKTLKSMAKDKKIIIVMGDMLELGKLEAQAHKEIGSFIGSLTPFFLITVGQASKILVAEAREKIGWEKAVWVESEEEIMPFLTPYLTDKSIILIKGSRAIGLDKLVERLS